MFHPTEEMNGQTIGEFTDRVDGLLEKGAIDEGEWKELLDVNDCALLSSTVQKTTW